MMNEKHIVMFSGGKDSTALLLKMIELNMQIDEIISVDTGVEFPEMYNHIKKVENFIKQPITILKFDESFEHYMTKHTKTKGKNKGVASGYGWPDFKNRWCTTYKKNVITNYMKKYKEFKIIEYHGIAVDELERTKKNNDGRNIKYPMVDWDMTEQQALAYCYNLNFDWGGLYEKFVRVSCYLCPLSRISELEVVYNEFPDLWINMQRIDKQSYRDFRSDYTLDELTYKFKEKASQKKLF